jgi:enoyl-CoA hydratase/carnithine racemase
VDSSGPATVTGQRSAEVFQHIVYEVEAPVATITLNRPAQLNAWTALMGQEVREAIRLATADADVVGIILTGAGRGFCAGADVSTLAGHVPDGEASPALPTEKDGYEFLMRCPKPIIAAINGPAAGLAVPVVLHCDLRFIADDAIMTTAFAQRGLVAEWGIGWLLSRLAGPGVAMDALLSSRRIDGVEAARLGLVNASMPAERLLPHARDYIRQLADRCSPTSIAIMKAQVWGDLERTYAESLSLGVRLMHESFQRPDFREGVSSYVERRPPAFPRLTEPPA